MSNAPYQIRTTYLDGSTTSDMIDNTDNNPKWALNKYILDAPNTYEDTYSIEVLDLAGNSLHVFTFRPEMERRAA